MYIDEFRIKKHSTPPKIPTLNVEKSASILTSDDKENIMSFRPMHFETGTPNRSTRSKFVEESYVDGSSYQGE